VIEQAIAGGRVRALRELFGYTQKALSADIGISQARLSKIENGLALADHDLLERIAEVADVPMTFLLADPVGITEGSLRFRKTSTARRGETKQISQLFIETYRVCCELAGQARLTPPALPTATADIVDSPEIELLADATRSVLGVPEGQPVSHVTRTCERAGIFVVPLHLPNAQLDEGVIGHSGVSGWRAPWDPAVIGFLPSMPGDRLRHTIAHELGHLVLHQARRPSKAVEQEAHRFAGAFLMPRHRAEEVFTTAQPLTLGRLQAMKAGWGMAIQALIMRAWHLGLIDEERRTSLFRQLSARGWRTAEPIKVHAERPLLFHKLLAIRYGTPLDWRSARDELGLSGEMLGALAPEPA
jgi:Zn-dependent peptidase ImmA (M78 family)/transcriptional regulator with XRE-family HTH domain